MSPAEFMDIILGFSFLIAVTGITVRFTLRPFANAKARLRGGESQQLLEQRISRIEAEMESIGELRTTMERLTEELEFQRQLTLPPAASSAAVRLGA